MAEQRREADSNSPTALPLPKLPTLGRSFFRLIGAQKQNIGPARQDGRPGLALIAPPDRRRGGYVLRAR
jgi:hypothetical protein